MTGEQGALQDKIDHLVINKEKYLIILLESRVNQGTIMGATSRRQTEVRSGKQSAYNRTIGISVYELYCSGDVNVLVLEDIGGIKRKSWK